MNARIIRLSDTTNISDNVIQAAESAQFQGSPLTFTDNNAQFLLGNNSVISSCDIQLGTNSKLVIGSDCRISGRITVGYNSAIIIGDSLKVTKNVTLRAVESTCLQIGSDCLFASDIVLRTTDGHPIYDAKTRERINSSKSITVGNHVWIADDVIILKGCIIGDASIIAARSVVTHSIPSHSVCAGAPAKVVRSGVTWEHSVGMRTEEFYL